MIVYRIFPNTGILIGRYTVDSIYIDQSWTMTSVQLIEEHGFIKPRLNFNLQEWEEGATEEEIEADRRLQIPDPISRMRLKMQLIRMGISLGSILDAIGQITDEMQRDLTFTMWNDAVTFDRYDPQLNAMAAMMGITQEQLDYIFTEGNK